MARGVCRMPVAMIVDQWSAAEKKNRYETFAHRPKLPGHRDVPGLG